jgi:hypothetical protein
MRVMQSDVRGIQATGALGGIQCCALLPNGTPPVAPLCRTGADAVSFDAYHRVA